MKINKILLILTLFLLFNCDYQPIYSSKNIEKNNNFTINSIVFSGENKINITLKNKLINYLNLESKKRNYDLNINSSIIRKISSKNAKGDPERFIIIIIFNIDFLENDKLKSNKKFEEKYEYKNMESKHDLKIYEQEIKNILVEGISEDLIKYLNSIE